MGWAVRNVGQNGDKGRRRKGSTQAFAQRPIEMRYKRRDEIRVCILPVAFQQLNGFAVVYAYDKLQNPHQMWAAQRPAVLQHSVVDILNAQTCYSANKINGVEYL